MLLHGVTECLEPLGRMLVQLELTYELLSALKQRLRLARING